MKSFATFLLAAMIIFCCAACTPSATPAAATASPAAATTSPATASPAAASPTATAEATASAQPTDAAAKDYAKLGDDLLNSDSLGKLKYGMTESDVEAAIGKPDTKGAPVMQGADGKNHSMWTYAAKGLTLNMAQGDDKKYVVSTITAIAPCDLATSKGIKIGSTKDEVMKAYGDAIDPQKDTTGQTTITAGTEFGGIIFGVDKDKVILIFIGAAAE